MKTKIVLIQLLILFITSCNQINISNIDKVKITQTYYFKNSLYEEIIYNDSTTKVKSLLDELTRSKQIWVGFVIKEVLKEGEYKIELFSKNKIIGTYIVMNSENVYDEINKIYLKSKIINYIPNKRHINE